MRKPKLILETAIVISALCACSGGQSSVSSEEIVDKDAFYQSELVRPYWLSNVMSEEAVTMVKYNKTADACGYLGFTPKKVLKVTNYAKSETYVEGVDYEVDGITITKLPRSSMPELNYSDLVGNQPLGLGAMEGYTQYIQYTNERYRNEGTYIYYNEYGSLLTASQVLVTYEYDNTQVKAKASYQGEKLPKIMNKLLNKEDFTLLVHGDSVCVGCNASGYLNERPFMDPWFKLFKQGLESKYGSNITLKNTAVGGTQSCWGAGLVDFSSTVKADLKANIVDQNPDLVVLGFGMNDGSANVSVDSYISNIRKIITDTRNLMNKDVEFIVLNTFLPNPMSAQDTGMQKKYKEPLQELCDSLEGVIMVDQSAEQIELMENKFYADMLSNNINHPNDFYVRVYAMNLLSALIKY